jgi:hypothetical protein
MILIEASTGVETEDNEPSNRELVSDRKYYKMPARFAEA